jgi:serine protease Do
MQSPKNFVQGAWSDLRAGRLTTTFALLAALTFGILAGSVLTGHVSASSKQVDSSDARPLTIPNPVTLSNGFSKIVQQVGPAVVNISTESLPKTAKTRRNRRGMQVDPHMQTPPDGDDDDQGGDDSQGGDGNNMQDFFNHFFGGGGGGQAQAEPSRALGSGFIVDSRGYIITNNHVVDKADHIYVKLSTDPQDDADQGRPATVIGVDKDTDIAVIKIDTKEPLPTIKLGNSEGAQVGDWVLAIGSPFGLRQTVSAGIVSAKNRSIDEGPGPGGVATNQFQKFIQTDAAINPGNSGGPLVDMSGQVIGMNTAIYTQSAGSEGIGFAMPSNTLIGVYNMLISPEHKVTRGSIGITFQAMQSSAVSRMYGFSDGGVLVNSITPAGPAAKAGLQPGDVIMSVDGKPVKDGDALVAIISERKPGSTVRLGYLRNGKRDSAEVGIADRAKLFANLGSTPDDTETPSTEDAGQTKLGITVQDITPAVAAKLGVSGGVMITNVKPGSFADEIALSKGQVITELNRHPVNNTGSLNSLVGNLKSGEDVVFVVRTPGTSNGPSYIGGTLP